MKHSLDKEYLNIAITFLAVIATAAFSIVSDKGIDIKFPWAITAMLASASAAVFSLYVTRMREKQLRKQRIFIIYAINDRDAALMITRQLKERGYNPWFDVEEMAPGQKWIPTVQKAIENSAVALLLVSNSLDLELGFAADELRTAMQIMNSRDESFSPIIPVRLDDAPLPKELADVYAVDLNTKDGFEQLERGLKRILGT